MAEFTHFNKEGNAVMVDIHEKEDTYRTAVASGRIYVSRRVYEAIVDRTAKKGDVLGVARIAGIMGAKKNAELIPLCHIIALTDCEITFELCEEDCCVTAYCKTSCVGKTGVEMEALTGVSVALLTIYDMCKSMDPRHADFGHSFAGKGRGKKRTLYSEWRLTWIDIRWGLSPQAIRALQESGRM